MVMFLSTMRLFFFLLGFFLLMMFMEGEPAGSDCSSSSYLLFYLVLVCMLWIFLFLVLLMQSISTSSSDAIHPLMALSFQSLLFIFASLLVLQTLADAATCSDCFTQSRAAYYPNSDEQGTETGACGFGSFGASVNGGDVSAASDLYRSGLGCGACYQVRCLDSKYCSENGVTAVITDQGSSDRTDFILSRRAFGRMAQTTDAASSLISQGVVDIEYRRVSCSYPNKNITIKIDENSDFPHYLAFVIRYQQGKKDITAVQLCETQNFVCKLLDRSHGAVWTSNSPPSGPLSLRMLFSDDDGDETWVVPVNNIPQDWKAGDVYDSGVQVNQ